VSGFNCAGGQILAGEQPKNPQNKPDGSVFQLPWRARAQQLAHHQTQVEGAHMSQLPLENVLSAAQVAAAFHPFRNSRQSCVRQTRPAF